MELQGKLVVVTGAGGGLGRALVLELLRRQARVAAVDIKARALAETAAAAGAPPGALGTFALSVADRAAVEALPGAVAAQLGPVDGVLNNAGIIQPFVRLNELSIEAVERVFDVNWRGTLLMTKAFLPGLLTRPVAHVVNISSMGGFLPIPGQAAYGASKAAVKLFTEGLHSELAGTPVRVTVVFPGALATDIAANSGVAIAAPSGPAPRVRMTSAAEAARRILDGVEQDRFRVLVGSDARFLDVLYRLDPRRATAFIARQMKELLP